MKSQILICFILGLSILILFFIGTITLVHPHRKIKSNICRDYLTEKEYFTDKEYLEHTIPHRKTKAIYVEVT